MSGIHKKNVENSTYGENIGGITLNGFQDKANFIWSIAELLRGDYKQSDYGKVILPLTVLRRMDCVLEPTKGKVLAELDVLKKMDIKNETMLEELLNKAAGQTFHNTSLFDLDKLKADPNNIAANLRNYLNGFSRNARDIMEYFRFEAQIEHLDQSNLLFQIVSKFTDPAIDLHPDKVSNLEMGYIFEELIRRFSEQSNETAGEHFTPREVIRLMVNLLFIEDDDILTKKGIIKTLYDPACGTGGMLSVAHEYLNHLNPNAQLEVFGQEINDESYAICKSDMLIKGFKANNIKYGNSFSQDGLPAEKFDYLLSNPPFGVEWKKVESVIRNEYEKKGMDGRFGAGLPRISDGSLLFLQHMIAKMRPVEKGGSRLAIVFNGSPLFSGSADSGESNIRRWIIENDWLEAVVAMPDQLFYNTGISTYLWIVTNRKSAKRQGKVQLVNAVSFFEKMRKSLGNKRNEISEGQIEEITRIYGTFRAGEYCKVFDNADFGRYRITVERPLRLNFQTSQERLQVLKETKQFQKLAIKEQADILACLQTIDSAITFKSRDDFAKSLKKACKSGGISLPAAIEKVIMISLAEKDETADVCRDAKGNMEADTDLRDNENIPLKEDMQEYFEREVLPHVPDAWIDESKTKVGYEIPFTRHFYTYEPLRPLVEVEAEIQRVEQEIAELLTGLVQG